MPPVSAPRRPLPWRLLSFAFLLLGAVVWYGATSFDSAPSSLALEGAPVRRGPLHIALTARGNLRAADSVSLKSEVEGRTTILTLVPEGTLVEKGDLVCELDATSLVEKRFQQSLSVRNAEAALVKSRQNLQIQESQNESDLARASKKAEFAAQDVTKFADGERAFQHDKSQQAIDLAREDAARAEDKLAWSQRLSERGFLTSSELEADRVASHRAAVALEQAQRTLDLLERFQLPRTQDELEAAREEALREVHRVELQANARLVDLRADVATNEAKFDLEQEKLAQLEAQIAKARMHAPRAGMLVYAQLDSDEPPIQEGTEVREREEILSIPSAAGMIAEAKLHETVVKQVQIGQRCTITIDALPGVQFGGRVKFMSLLPDQTSRWMNPNMRLYRTDIELDASSADVRPGMSCAIEIQVEDLEDVVHVPVQSVSRVGRENVCFVRRADGEVERRPVSIGRYNEEWVQILTGLEVGETVLLSPPPGFDAQPGFAGDELPEVAGTAAATTPR